MSLPLLLVSPNIGCRRNIVTLAESFSAVSKRTLSHQYDSGCQGCSGGIPTEGGKKMNDINKKTLLFSLIRN